MTRVYDKQSFIQKAETKHGKKFDYQKFEYISAKTKSIIICPVHGEYEQTPDKHLQSKHGCLKCSKDYRGNMKKGKPPKCKRESITEEVYRLRVETKYGTKFELDFSEYIGWTKGFIIIKCPKHGVSKYNPQSFLTSNYGCRQCGIDQKVKSNTKPYEQFISESEIIHKNKYSYPSSNKSIYKNRKSSVKIICPIHGEFEKKAQKHLSGQGCFPCRIEELIESGSLPGGYHEKIFERNTDLKNRIGYVYYLKIGQVYKIGITTNLRQRIRALRSVSKENVEIIQIYKCSLYKAYLIEKMILNDFEIDRIKLDWSTELFKSNVLYGQDLEKLSKRIHIPI